MSENEVYEYWTSSDGFLNDKPKVQHLKASNRWNVEAAKKILNTWQRKFVEVRYD